MGQGASAALWHAAATGNLEQLETILDQGADVNAQEEESQWSALHHAAWGGHEKVARELLVRGADPNSRSNERKTPLHMAVLNGDPGTAQALLDHGAVVNAADEEGQTPLHKAAVQGQLDLAQELIARGANINAQLQDGTTPAHLACWKGHSQVLAYMLNSEADAEARDMAGQTPLHVAAAAGQEACCRELLSHGADTAALDAESRSPADVAYLNSFPHIAELVKPKPGEVEARMRQAQRAAKAAAEPAEPSAPVWQPPPPSPTSHLPYPVVDQTFQPAQPRRDPTDPTPTPASQPGPIRGHREAEDWEPRPEEDWEGVEPAPAGPNRGARLMNQYAEANPDAGEQRSMFWMVPQPMRWAAGGLAGALGGFANNFNPWRAEASLAMPPQEDTEMADEGEEASQALLEAREAEVARLSEPRTREQLTEKQLLKLSQQEAELAELRQKLGVAGGPSKDATTAEEPEQAADSRERHHIIDLPPQAAPTCSQVSVEELSQATGGFPDSGKLAETAAGTCYHGVMQGSQVAVWVPRERDTLPWRSVKAVADRLAAARSRHLVAIRGVCPDGSTVFDLMQNGSVEGALCNRPPLPGQPPVRLDWPLRVRIALSAAQGLSELQAASLSISPTAVTPSNVLLTDDLAVKLQPPSVASILTETTREEVTSSSAPEVRSGESPSPASDVYSLGILILQLLTGSEASGLLDHVQAAIRRGALADVLDPCADGILPSQALPLAELGLRCTSMHAEDRPDLRAEVLPALFGIAEQAKAGGDVVAAEEAPAHLICPITRDVMEQPMLLSDGYTYEESAIKRWLNSGNTVSPMTNQRLESHTLTPNYVIKSAASSWRESHPSQRGAAAISQPTRSVRQASSSSVYPQLPIQPVRPPAPPDRTPQQSAAQQPSSTQKLRDEIASLNASIAERNQVAEGPAERMEEAAEGSGVTEEGEIPAQGSAADVGTQETEEDLPSAPTHRISTRASNNGERVFAQYAA